MRRFVLSGLLLLLGSELVSQAAQLVPFNSTWRFRRGGSEASSPASAWRASGFNDTEFSSAPSPFWYGDAQPSGTRLTDMQNAYTCIYLRREFVLANAAEIGALRLSAYVDDGFVAWINGVEVQRERVAGGEPNFQTTAANAPEPAPSAAYTLLAPGAYLRNGVNVLAVQVFNTSAGSSDLVFDCALESILAETTPPVVSSVTPAPGIVSGLTSITVTFSEPVTGVDANDLLVGGVPPNSVSGEGSSYTFGFPQPLYGAVHVGWAAGHGIADLATPPNPFNAAAAGSSWQYQLTDMAAPQVSSLHPPAGTAVRSLSQLEVRFSEDVLGVEAADLLINGQPAQQALQQPDGAFLFRFPAQPAGPVQAAWRAGHGITDAAAAPNPFAGGAWSYVVDPNAPEADLVITEILAANLSGLADEDGEPQDWIEIYNRGTSPVNLANWSLTDDAALPGLWTFPARSLAPNEYLVVFASGKDRKPAAGPLHTNFKLGGAGEHLGLYTPDAPRVRRSGFEEYPEQRNDISYGADASGALKYFAAPSPGQPNGLSAIEGVCAPVHVNVQRGHFSAPFDLHVSAATPDAVVRYTLDGSEPTASSPIFQPPLRLNNTTLFRAAAFKTNHLPSRPVTHSYLFNLPANLRSLPVISIVTAPNHLYGPSGILGINGGNYNSGPWVPNPGAANDYHNPSKHGLAWERPTSAELIEPGDNSGFQIDCGIRVQGSDYQRPRLTPSSKFSFRLYFRNDYGPGRLEYPLLPLTTVQRFDQLVLRAGFNEQGNPFIRDEIHRRLSHDMGQVASHGTLAIVMVNGVYYANSPWYNPCERVHEEFLQEHLGGGEDWDVVGPTFAQSADAPGVIDGDRADFQNMVNYARSNPLTSQAAYLNLASRLDLTNFVDYCLLNAYAAMGDWPANNWRAGKDRGPGGIWRFLVWDAEWGMGIYDRSININSFTQTGGGPNDSGLGSVSSSEIATLYDRLRASPEFRLLWADRVQKHFFNGGALTGGNITNRFQELRAQLQPLMPNMETEILVWARDRQAIFFRQMEPYGLVASSNAPVFSQHGGTVPEGFLLTLRNLSGTIYYTTDGSDPRGAFTGAVSSSAQAYSAPVALPGSVQVKARSLQGTTWSALTEAAFQIASLGSPLRITEIMYNPSGGSLYEFLELHNTSGAEVDLSGLHFDGIQFTFGTGAKLAGGARLVLASNTDMSAWQARYPGVTPAGWFNGALNNAGERITLLDRNGAIIESVDYRSDEGWPAEADGSGASLELISLRGGPDDPANWQASAHPQGTPGAANSAAVAPRVEINELMAENSTIKNGDTFPDWIELRNPGSTAVDLSGWSLSDGGDPREFVFPAGTMIPPMEYLVVWCDAPTNAAPGLHTGFALSREGETVALYDAAGKRADIVTFGPQGANYSLGRFDSGWKPAQPTPQAANTLAETGPLSALVINEWLANPAPGEDDWFEIYNNADTVADLTGLHVAAGGVVQRLYAPSFIGPRGHARIYASEKPRQLDLKLAASGGSIVLYDAAGAELQRIGYSTQAEGVSQGRLPDGGPNVTGFPGTGSPGAPNYTAIYSGPVLNEVLARNRSALIGGRITDYVELHNAGSASFDLSGMSLSVDAPAPRQWVFPPNTVMAPGAYLVIACDNTRPASFAPGDLNLGEALDGDSGGVYLFNAAGQTVQSVEYGFQIDDMPIGLDGGQWKLLNAPTPGAANSAPATVVGSSLLRMNEWMADPEEGEDWFELFNPAAFPVDLSALSLTDDPSIAGRGQFRPAPLSFIGGGGFVKWVADSRPGQGRNHVNFGLNAAGDSILIYAVSGSSFQLVDGAAFGAQELGVSQGSLPDGADTTREFRGGSASPGASNTSRLGFEDSDGDGLPNLVETQAGLDPNNPADGVLDLDGDGVSNLHEHLAGTDLRDPASYLRVEASRTANGVTIQFRAAPERSYSVQWTDALTAPAWKKLADAPARPAAETVSITDTQPLAAQRYYRLVTPAAP